VRRSEDIPFKSYLEEFGDNLVIHDKLVGKGMNIKHLIEKANDNTHIYTCGPERLLTAVIEAAESCGVAKDHVHLEAYTAATSGDPFTAELRLSKKSLEVGTTMTLLDVLRDAGLDIFSSCEAGNFGTCRVNVEKGGIDHRGNRALGI
jgi:ferredoxin-NADP reductase